MDDLEVFRRCNVSIRRDISDLQADLDRIAPRPEGDAGVLTDAERCDAIAAIYRRLHARYPETLAGDDPSRRAVIEALFRKVGRPLPWKVS